MNKIIFIISILLVVCAIMMFYAAVTIYSSMQLVNIAFTAIVLIGTLLLSRILFKEMKHEND